MLPSSVLRTEVTLLKSSNAAKAALKNSGRSPYDAPQRSSDANRTVSFEPQPLQKRKSRVAFEIPAARDADDDEAYDDHPRSRDGIVIAGGISDEDDSRENSEVLEICRRMWALGSVGLAQES